MAEELVSLVNAEVERRNTQAKDMFLVPELLFALPFDVLCKLPLICKSFAAAAKEKDDKHCYWHAMGHSFARHYGIYINADRIVNKSDFFAELWPLRTKWKVTLDGELNETMLGNANSFKIQIASRFRPGPTPRENLNLPLHQFLKIKRKQLKEAGSAEAQGKPLVGSSDPEEFLDPMLGTLMKDPVRLKTSGQIVSRSVAIQSILRGGRDPFNSRRLTHAQLEDLPDLAQRIEEYKLEKAKKDDVSLDRKDVMQFVEGSQIDPDILAALIEADRIASASERAESDASLEDAVGRRKSGSASSTECGSSGGSSDDRAGPETDSESEPVDVSLAAAGEDADVRDPLSDDGALVRASFNHNNGTGNSRWRKGEKDTSRVVDVNTQKCSVAMHVPGLGIRPFYFNKVHSGKTTQKKVYDESVSELVQNTMNGFNTCVLCYGQTGSGKTHTMFGPPGALDAFLDEEELDNDTGVVVRACVELIQAKRHMGRLGVNVAITAKMIEIYNEEVSDLLSGNAAQVSRTNGEVIGAIDVPLTDINEVTTFIKAGEARKRFAATAMNDRSSRSHTAIILTVKQSFADSMVSSQFTLVDLAGSERIKKSLVTGKHVKEAIGINSSLLILGKVIAALVESKRHVPYFESKLTTLLKGAFGGNCRTSVIIAGRMESSNGDETLQSLRFGERCGLISNSTLVAASSATSALKALDSSIDKVRSQMDSLEARGKTHLASYKRVAQGLKDLMAKRETVVIAAGKEGTKMADNGAQSPLPAE